MSNVIDLKHKKAEKKLYDVMNEILSEPKEDFLKRMVKEGKIKEEDL